MNIDTIILSEPEKVENFFPFSILHPVFDIRVGSLKIWEILKKEIPNVNLIFAGREKIIQNFLERYQLSNPKLEKGVTVVLSSNILFDSNFFDELSAALVNYPGKSLRINYKGKAVGGIFSTANWVENLTANDIKNYGSGIWENFSEIEFSKVKSLEYIWDAIYQNGSFINQSKDYFRNYKDAQGITFNGSHLINPSNIILGGNVRIMPGVVIDASEGTVIIDSNVKIMPQSTIIGPAYIGKNSQIKIGAKIYPNTSIGEWCKIGGEIEDSILQGFANKQHDGFLGHSFISEWVNLGAGTDTSDLKNTYGKISVELAGEKINSYKQFLGFICGDHTKTAIGTKINSGTVTGIASMIMQSGFPPKSISSFSWLTDEKSELNKLDSALKTARIVKSRRNQELTEIEVELMKNEFEKVNNAK